MRNRIVPAVAGPIAVGGVLKAEFGAVQRVSRRVDKQVFDSAIQNRRSLPWNPR